MDQGNLTIGEFTEAPKRPVKEIPHLEVDHHFPATALVANVNSNVIAPTPVQQLHVPDSLGELQVDDPVVYQEALLASCVCACPFLLLNTCMRRQ
jgi:hypothetical protein